MALTVVSKPSPLESSLRSVASSSAMTRYIRKQPARIHRADNLSPTGSNQRYARLQGLPATLRQPRPECSNRLFDPRNSLFHPGFAHEHRFTLGCPLWRVHVRLVGSPQESDIRCLPLHHRQHHPDHIDGVLDTHDDGAFRGGYWCW